MSRFPSVGTFAHTYASSTSSNSSHADITEVEPKRKPFGQSFEDLMGEMSSSHLSLASQMLSPDLQASSSIVKSPSLSPTSIPNFQLSPHLQDNPNHNLSELSNLSHDQLQVLLRLVKSLPNFSEKAGKVALEGSKNQLPLSATHSEIAQSFPGLFSSSSSSKHKTSFVASPPTQIPSPTDDTLPQPPIITPYMTSSGGSFEMNMSEEIFGENQFDYSSFISSLSSQHLTDSQDYFQHGLAHQSSSVKHFSNTTGLANLMVRSV
jgi:hypothetical protein